MKFALRDYEIKEIHIRFQTCFFSQMVKGCDSLQDAVTQTVVFMMQKQRKVPGTTESLQILYKLYKFQPLHSLCKSKGLHTHLSHGP